MTDHDSKTEFFYELTPDRVLSSVEKLGVRCTGRAFTLYAMENRVFEVEIEVPNEPAIDSPSDRFRIAKFYRPGRWSREALEDEHSFLLELAKIEVPVVAPLHFPDGSTVGELPDTGIFFAVFPKQGGRSLDELSEPQLEQLGRLIARVHGVGLRRRAEHRPVLTPETLGLQNLRFLVDSRVLPEDLRTVYQRIVEQICAMSAPWFAATPNQRIHGDCHLGNVLFNAQGMFLVDFDDLVNGPCVQDLWLIELGRDGEALRRRGILLAGYEQMRPFDRGSLRLIEPLRALRFVHFAAWIARRWEDPAFPRAFPHFGSQEYWRGQLVDLQEQLALIQEGDASLYSGGQGF